MVKLVSLDGGKPAPPSPPSPPPPPEDGIVDYLRDVLARAERGEVTEYIAVLVDPHGNLISSYLLTRKTTELALRVFIDFDSLAEHLNEALQGPE